MNLKNSISISRNLNSRYLPDTDDRVSVSTEQSLSVSTPRKGDTLMRVGLHCNLAKVGLQLIDDTLALQVPDLDSTAGGSAQPVSVRTEAEGVDRISGLEGVEVFALVEIPQHGDSILSSGCAEGTIGGDGDGGDVSGVTIMVGLELAFGQIPDLKEVRNSSREERRRIDK